MHFYLLSTYNYSSRLNGVSCGEESMTIIYSAVLIQCQRVTDGQTDGRTEVQPLRASA